MKKVFFPAFAVLAIFGISACKNKTSFAKEITLVMAEVNPETSISAQMDKAFKEKVEELSDGKIKIELYCGGTLGDEQTIMELMTKPGSTIHLERISAFNLTAYGCQKSSLLSIPYTFKNKAHFWNFANSELASEILTESYDKKIGLRGLFFGEEGFRHFFSTRPLTGTKDFKGRKVRTTADHIMMGLVQGLEAEPVSVAFADLYSALQTGVADAAEQPIANYLANHFNQVAPYMILDGHTLGVTEVIISSEVWDSLSQKQQDILIEAGKYAGAVCKEFSQRSEDVAKLKLIANGAVFTDVTDITPWQASSAKIIEESTQTDKDLYKKILELAD